MAHPLELSYNWQLPITFSTVGLSICVGVLVNGRTDGWLPVVVILVLLWAGFLGLVWLRTRALMLVDGPVLRVRTVLTTHEVRGPDVRTVEQRRTPNGPSYRLTVLVDGASRRVSVPAALLRHGHATLFGWILAEAPQAQLDRGSRTTLAALQTHGSVPDARSGR
jgi:hypothetical protein